MTTSATPPIHPALLPDLSRIAQDLQIRKIHVENVLKLLDEQNTVPFINRYRKEMTGGLNEEVIRKIQHRVGQMRHLAERKQTILKTIEGQGKLTDELRGAILAAESPKRVEDLYLPYKPKKRSLASEAREKNLEPLALAIWSRDPAAANLVELLPTMLNPEKHLNTPDDILAGVKHILAEIISELADLRGAIRQIVWDPSSKIVSQKSESLPEGKGNEYRGYFDFSESVQTIPPHRILAINRGEKEEALKVRLDYETNRVKQAAAVTVPLEGHPHRELLEAVVEDALARLLLPSLEREVRRELTDFAQEHAVSVFARNLRSLLLQPPLRGKRLLGIDPGLRNGCKVAALDDFGNLLEHCILYPHQPQNKKAAAKIELEALIRKHQLSVVAIGNGTACRETERLVSELIAEFEARRTGVVPKAEPTPPAAEPASVPVVEGATAETASAPPADGLAAPLDTAPAPAAEAAPPAPADTALAPAAEAAPPTPAPVVEAPPTPEVVSPPADVTPLPATDTPAVAPTSPEGSGAPIDAPPTAEAAAAPPVEQPAAPPPKPPEPELPKIDLSVLPPPPEDLAYVIVNEAGASDYSASQVAREEFPDFDATLRGTISIGRRLQDPLSELVKIDPQHIGVGLYQHDMKSRNLKESLEGVVESCVNFVGVDLNTANAPLLRHVSGLNALSAQNVVAFRKQNGPFRSREQLQQVPQLGPKGFEQAAGFLKIPGGEEPLDETWIHPESYPVARQILADTGFQPADLRDKAKLIQIREKLNTVHPEVYDEKFKTGMLTVRDIFDALARPQRDPREDLPPPIFRKGILKIEDLQPGMELKGTVLNVVDFGAFVDVGLKDSGLVHISQMANRYIKSPYEVVSVGDVVTVWVRSVDMERRHVALTMIQPGAERKPGERRQGPPREQREPREPREPRQEGPRQEGPRHGGPRREGPPRQGDAPPRQDAPRHGPPRRDGSGPPRRGGGDRGRRHGPPGQQPVPPASSSAPGAAPLPIPPPQPQRPRRPDKPLPKLSQSAIKGESPLHSFGELAAFYKAKEEPPAPPPPVAESSPPPPPPPPVAESLPRPPAEEESKPPEPPATESSDAASQPPP